jgi:hypothetical protein
VQTPSQFLSPEQKVERLRRTANSQTDMNSKNRAMKAIARASASLPVLTIAISERVRLEMEARRRANENYKKHLEVEIATSGDRFLRED